MGSNPKSNPKPMMEATSISQSSSISISEKDQNRDEEINGEKETKLLLGLGLSDHQVNNDNSCEDSSSSSLGPMVTELNLIGSIGGAASRGLKRPAPRKERGANHRSQSKSRELFSCATTAKQILQFTGTWWSPERTQEARATLAEAGREPCRCAGQSTSWGP
ncbi:uncharacterized protein A4U43_C05F33570 [Asparagus officinalis]|uniref:Uncharacterized protein n=1 Tax=Asparagus officinalis TaxID=4686 RepID=A0A5P1EWZ3_ASPOF|nr:uncharacterized protein A4U43_C05F33570 [Asparagus officinalis]